MISPSSSRNYYDIVLTFIIIECYNTCGGRIMSFEVEIINLSSFTKDNIDYETVLFHVTYPDTIEMETSREIWVFLNTLIHGGVKKIIINLKKVSLIDSAGISTIISATKHIRKNNGDLVISSVNDSIQNILDILKIEKFIKIYRTDMEAQQYFRYTIN